MYRFLIVLIAFIGLPALVVTYAGADEAGQWRQYAGDNDSTKYAPLDQINRDNFKDLRIAWRWSSVDDEILNDNSGLWTWAYEATQAS
jgi:glucose dehydrogenase